MVRISGQKREGTNTCHKDGEESPGRSIGLLSSIPGHVHQCRGTFTGRKPRRSPEETETGIQRCSLDELLHLAGRAARQLFCCPLELSSFVRASCGRLLEHVPLVEDEQTPTRSTSINKYKYQQGGGDYNENKISRCHFDLFLINIIASTFYLISDCFHLH